MRRDKSGLGSQSRLKVALSLRWAKGVDGVRKARKVGAICLGNPDTALLPSNVFMNHNASRDRRPRGAEARAEGEFMSKLLMIM